MSRLLCRIHPRALPPGHGRGGHEFPLPQLRAAFQRASVPDPRLLPLPDENDEGAYAHAFRLLDPLPGQHHSQRGKPGIGDKIPGGGGTVRAYSERFGFPDPCPPHGGRDHGYGGLSGPAGAVLFPLALGDDFSSGHRAGGRGSARGQQTGVPAHALGHGRPAGARGYGYPLRASFYNQYVFLEDSDENLRMFEKRARNMQSLSRYSRGNQINKEWVRYVAV